jgi:hypothetical protein
MSESVEFSCSCQQLSSDRKIQLYSRVPVIVSVRPPKASKSVKGTWGSKTVELCVTPPITAVSLRGLRFSMLCFGTTEPVCPS